MASLLDQVRKLQAAKAARDARISTFSDSDRQHRASQLYGMNPRVTQLLDLALSRMHAAEHSDLA